VRVLRKRSGSFRSVSRRRETVALRFHASRKPGMVVTDHPSNACVALGYAIHASPKPWVTIGLRFPATPKPGVAILGPPARRIRRAPGYPSNACVRPMAAAGESFCALAFPLCAESPVVCHRGKPAQRIR